MYTQQSVQVTNGQCMTSRRKLSTVLIKFTVYKQMTLSVEYLCSILLESPAWRNAQNWELGTSNGNCHKDLESWKVTLRGLWMCFVHNQVRDKYHQHHHKITTAWCYYMVRARDWMLLDYNIFIVAKRLFMQIICSHTYWVV